MRRQSKKIIMYTILILLAFIGLFPFWIMIINSTRSTQQINMGFSLLPGSSIINNFHEMQARNNVLRSFGNSLYISLLSTALTCYFSAMTAHALVSYKMKGKGIIFGAILVIMMLPSQLNLIGYHKFMKDLGLLNSHLPLILSSISSAISVFFIKQYAETALSSSMIEAARIDGAGEFAIFNRIALPVLSPAIFTMGINAFVTSWNSFLLPMTLLSTENKFTMPIIIRRMVQDTQNPTLGGTYLAIAISMIPIIVVFAFFQRYIIDGVGAGGEKE